MCIYLGSKISAASLRHSWAPIQKNYCYVPHEKIQRLWENSTPPPPPQIIPNIPIHACSAEPSPYPGMVCRQRCLPARRHSFPLDARLIFHFLFLISYLQINMQKYWFVKVSSQWWLWDWMQMIKESYKVDLNWYFFCNFWSFNFDRRINSFSIRTEIVDRGRKT